MIAKSQTLQDEKGIESEDEAGRCRAAIIGVFEMLHKWVGYTCVYINIHIIYVCSMHVIYIYIV